MFETIVAFASKSDGRPHAQVLSAICDRVAVHIGPSTRKHISNGPHLGLKDRTSPGDKHASNGAKYNIANLVGRTRKQDDKRNHISAKSTKRLMGDPVLITFRSVLQYLHGRLSVQF